MKKFIPDFAATTMILTLSAAASVSAGAITAFSIDDAAAAAFTKAGVNEADAVVYKKAWEYDNGAEKYEIKFFIPGQTKFDCDVDVVSCEVIKCESEPWDAEDEFEYGALTPNANADKEAEEAGLEKAAQTAFADAGVTEDQVVVYKRGTDFENGKAVYSINFFLPEKAKFDYDIDQATGTILTKEQDAWEAEDNAEFMNLVHPQEAAEAAAAAPAGELTETDAAAIALKDAGFSENDVTITECHKDVDDGVVKFDVSFRTADGAEYDYEIDAATGAIRDKDMEYDD